MFFFVFAVSQSLNPAKTQQFLGFHSKNQKTHRFAGFSASRHHENQKTHVLSWFCDRNIQKHSVKPKNNKNPAETKRFSPRFCFFGFGWFCWVAKLWEAGFQNNGCMCQCFNRTTQLSLSRAWKCAKTQIILRFWPENLGNNTYFQELDRKAASQNCGKQRGNKYGKIQFFSRSTEDRWITGGGGPYIYIYICKRNLYVLCDGLLGALYFLEFLEFSAFFKILKIPKILKILKKQMPFEAAGIFKISKNSKNFTNSKK